MDYPEEAKKTATQEVTKKVIALLWFLIVAIALALYYSIRYRILPGLSREWLEALSGIALVLCLLLFSYAVYLYYSRKAIQTKLSELGDGSQAEIARLQDLIDNPPKVFRFNVWWDKDGVPYCPLDKNMPLGNWVRTQFHGMFHCSMHNNYVPLMDDDGQHLYCTT